MPPVAEVFWREKKPLHMPMLHSTQVPQSCRMSRPVESAHGDSPLRFRLPHLWKSSANRKDFTRGKEQVYGSLEPIYKC